MINEHCLENIFKFISFEKLFTIFRLVSRDFNEKIKNYIEFSLKTPVKIKPEYIEEFAKKYRNCRLILSFPACTLCGKRFDEIICECEKTDYLEADKILENIDVLSRLDYFEIHDNVRELKK